jgi:hypothetical protein
MKTTELQIPVVHLNGTGKTALLKEVGEAIKAVEVAMDKVNNMTIHARDYYVKPNHETAFNEASSQATMRYRKLDAVLAELIEYRSGVFKQ